MIAVDKNTAVRTEDRTYECVVCSCNFISPRPINVLGDVVGGDGPEQRPKKCSRCKAEKHKKCTRLHEPGELVARKCIICGESFTFKWKGKRRTRCEGCKSAREQTRLCKVCGKLTGDNRRSFCSDECRAEREAALRKKTGKSPCVECGKMSAGVRCRACFLSAERSAVKARYKREAAITSFTGTAITGRSGEAYFDLIASVNGWRLFSPVGECTPSVDRVVIVDGKVKTVQIKSTKSIAGPSFKGMKVQSSDCDWVAVVTMDSLNMWIVEPSGMMDLSGCEPWSVFRSEPGSLPSHCGTGAGPVSGA